MHESVRRDSRCSYDYDDILFGEAVPGCVTSRGCCQRQIHTDAGSVQPNLYCADCRVQTAATQLTNDEVLGVLQERAAAQQQAGTQFASSEAKVTWLVE